MASWPVVSSISCFIVTPSMMSWKSPRPDFSGKNRHVIWIPLHEDLGLLHLLAIFDRDDRADDDVVDFEFAPVLREHGD